MTPGALAAFAIIGLGGIATLVVHRWHPHLRVPVLVATTATLVVAVTVLPTHPSAGGSGAQWQPIPTQGGLGTALRHLAEGRLDSAVQVMALVGAVYALLGVALAAAWPRPGRWMLVVPALTVTIEIVQYRWLGRVASLDDVLVATAAAGVGWLVASHVVRAHTAP